jgi:hypothetical protein
MIWKYARPVPRIVKLSRSNQQGICNSRIGCSLIHLVALGCSSDHLISGVPIPNLLHICSESRAIALKWYCLRFQPPCGHGGTFIDSEIDYLYYGPEQRKFLISPNSAVPRWGWAKDRNRWVKDRQSIPNIVVRCTGDSESWDLMTLMQTSVWCNEFAKQILLVFYWDIEERTMVSDLKPLLVQSCTSPRHPELVNNRDSKVVFAAWLKDARKLLPWWKRFNPERVESHHVFGTANQLQNFGFKREFFQDKKVDFSFQSAAIAH